MPDVQPGTVAVAYLHHNQIAGSFLTSLHKLAAACANLLWLPIQNQSNTDLAAGRNQCVASFLNQSPGEWLLFIDDDMGFAPDLVHKLLEAAHPVDRPVVGGLCFGYSRYETTDEHAERFIVGPTIYRFVETASEVGFAKLNDYPRDEVVQVDGTGAACLLIHRSVLQGMHDALGPNWFTTVSIPKGPAGQTTFSEDLSFCWRLRTAGIPIYVHTGARTSHRKAIYLDEWYFDHQPLRMETPKVAIVGTGNSGTGFISGCLSAMGAKVGHEQWWNPHGIQAPGLVGDASWIAANHLDDYDGEVWHQTRHPLAVIRSLIGSGIFDPDAPDWLRRYETERAHWAGYQPDDPPEVKALRVVAHWWAVCDSIATHTWRLEDVDAAMLCDLAGKLGRQVPDGFADVVLGKFGVGRNNHAGDCRITWAELPDGPDKQAVAEMAARFGYDDLEAVP